MISRRKILKGGAAAIVIASVPFKPRFAFAQSALPFDYFISANGDDDNVGSLASPWSITALNSKQSVYSGKRIGIIGDISGTQTPITHGTVGGVQTTLYSKLAANSNQPCLNVNGGSSSASTYIASCNSSGVYTPRSAIIDFANPAGGGIAAGEGFCFGQSNTSSTQVPSPGYVTYDALTIRNFNFSAICFINQGGSSLNGCVVQNCEIYNGSCASSANNPGAIRYNTVTGMTVKNCKIHDLGTTGGGGSPRWGFPAIGCYGAAGAAYATVITNNTIYNCTSILQKDSNSDFANCSYNYLDHGDFGSAANSDSGIGQGVVVSQQPASGVTSVFHHNVCLGPMWLQPQGSSILHGTYQIYNNTFYGTPNYPSFELMYCQLGLSGAALQFYHNLAYATNGYYAYSQYVQIGSIAIANATFNNNVYGNGMTFSIVDDVALSSFAAWQSATKCDQNSVLVSSSPFTGTPTAQVPSSFAAGSSAVIGGVMCGALDGSGIVGCDWSGEPVPAAPSLSVS